MQVQFRQAGNFVAQRTAPALIGPVLPATQVGQARVQRRERVLECTGQVARCAFRFDDARMQGDRAGGVAGVEPVPIRRDEAVDQLLLLALLFAFAPRALLVCGECGVEARARGEGRGQFGCGFGCSSARLRARRSDR